MRAPLPVPANTSVPGELPGVLFDVWSSPGTCISACAFLVADLRQAPIRSLSWYPTSQLPRSWSRSFSPKIDRTRASSRVCCRTGRCRSCPRSSCCPTLDQVFSTGHLSFSFTQHLTTVGETPLSSSGFSSATSTADLFAVSSLSFC